MYHHEALETVGEEAYSILKQFYAYDRNVPLESRAYDREEHEASVREKTVFRGVRDGLVPGYLGTPAGL
jgi:hypothetical protein